MARQLGLICSRPLALTHTIQPTLRANYVRSLLNMYFMRWIWKRLVSQILQQIRTLFWRGVACLPFGKKRYCFSCLCLTDCSGRNEGNPTRSFEDINLIKRVTMKEVWKQGVASQCRRAITEDKFRRMQTILQRHQPNSLVWRYGLYALTNFQFHLLLKLTTQDRY